MSNQLTPSSFTHAFVKNAHRADDTYGVIVPINQLEETLEGCHPFPKQFCLIHDINKIVVKVHTSASGRVTRSLSSNHGGWSWGHIRRGWFCAGAGGLNSMRVIPGKQEGVV